MIQSVMRVGASNACAVIINLVRFHLRKQKEFDPKALLSF